MVKFGLAHGSCAKDALDKLLENMKEWLDESHERHANIPWQGIHDEGTFLTSFREYYMHTGDAKVLTFATEMLKKADDWMQDNLHRGYYKRQEVHHGTEHFTIFLPWILEMDPGNKIARHQLREAANNVLGPDLGWYDHSKKRFSSIFLGTSRRRFKRITAYLTRKFLGANIVEHLRMARMAWLGLHCGGDEGLGTVVRDYTLEWVNAITRTDEIPVVLEGHEVRPRVLSFILSIIVGAAPKHLTKETRTEIHVANGTPSLFMDLHDAIDAPGGPPDEPRGQVSSACIKATRDILHPVLHQLGSPYAHPLGDIGWRLHSLEPLPELEEEVRKLVQEIPADSKDFDELDLHLESGVNWKDTGYHGTIGIRHDMPAVRVLKKNGNPGGACLPSPSTLGLLYRFTGDERYLQLGLEFANAAFLAARGKYDDGRTHGCSSRHVHAFCVGHGRNWGAGYVSTILRAAIGPGARDISLPSFG